MASSLRVHGFLNAGCLWPLGNSDADTLPMRVAHDGFRLREHDSGRERVIRVFDRACVVGRAVLPVLRGQRELTVRLQGIDAPELHYSPRVPGVRSTPPRFRQAFGERAALELSRRLARVGRGEIPCVLETRVELPGDAFDMYGRCVGDLYVGDGRAPLHVNDWLLRRGWAVAALYNAMTRDEVRRVLAATQLARAARRGVWRVYSAHVERFAWSRVFRPRQTELNRDDEGRVIIPTLYRRQATWAVSRRARVFEGSFVEYLASHERNHVHATDDFLREGPSAAPLIDIASLFGGGRFSVPPEAIVFREAPSRLEGPDGRAITRW